MVNPQTSESPTSAGTNRRKHGDGTIRTTPSGRFEVRWREPDPDSGEVKRRSRNFTDHHAAEQFLAERLMALRVDDGLDDLYAFITGQGSDPFASEYVPTPMGTFDWSVYRVTSDERLDFLFLVRRFIRDRHRRERAPKTFAQYRDLWRKVVASIGAQHPDALSVHAADDYLEWLGSNGHTPSTVNAIRGFLSAVCNFAIAKEYIERNPFAGSNRNRDSAPDPKAPTNEQVGAIYRAAQTVGMIEAITARLGMVTGSRPGEIPAFCWTDINWARAGIRRHQAASTATGFAGVQLGDTKTHKDDLVPLDQDTLGLLRLHREACEQRAEALGIELSEEGFILSPEPDGSRPFRPDALSRRFTKVAKTVPGAEWVRMSHLRKWTATTVRLLDAAAAMRRLSHDQLSTTERHYFAPDWERDAAVTRFLADRIGGANHL
jgi:integrase